MQIYQSFQKNMNYLIYLCIFVAIRWGGKLGTLKARPPAAKS